MDCECNTKIEDACLMHKLFQYRVQLSNFQPQRNMLPVIHRQRFKETFGRAMSRIACEANKDIAFSIYGCHKYSYIYSA